MNTLSAEGLVFLSYSRIDKRWVNDIALELESRGIPYWVDLESIAPGDEWPAKIAKAIDSAQVMVVILSDNASESMYVRCEVTYALKRGLVIIPCRAENAELKGGLGFTLANIQSMDVFDPPRDEKVRQIVDSVERVLGRKVTLVKPKQLLSGWPARLQRFGLKAGLLVAVVLAALSYSRGCSLSSIMGTRALYMAPMEIDGVEYRIENWGWQGNSLVFWFVAKNQGADAKIVITTFVSRLIDDNKEIKLASAVVVGEERSYGHLGVYLPAKTESRIKLFFDKIDPGVKMIQLLELGISGSSTLSFRNIPVAGRILSGNQKS